MGTNVLPKRNFLQYSNLLISNMKNIFDSANFTVDHFGRHSAWIGHIPFANWVTKEIKPQKIVELGSHWGHSYFAFCKTIREEKIPCTCYAVDTWMGDDHASHYGSDVYSNVCRHNEDNYSDFSKLLKMTFDKALDIIPEKSVDLLHIDGLHTYEAVKHDFESWLPKVKEGGIILFHDTEVHERGFGVWKLWKELVNQYPNHLNFTHSYGLGVLQNTHAKRDDYDWLNPSSKEQKLVIEYFTALGVVEIKSQSLREKTHEALKLHNRIASMENSLSWKITSPLRSIAAVLGK